MPSQELALAWPFGNGPVRVGTQGLFRPCLKTFVALFSRPDWLPLGLRGWCNTWVINILDRGSPKARDTRFTLNYLKLRIRDFKATAGVGKPKVSIRDYRIVRNFGSGLRDWRTLLGNLSIGRRQGEMVWVQTEGRTDVRSCDYQNLSYG